MGDARPAGLAAPSQGFTHHRGGKVGRASFRLGVQHRQQEGVQQPLPQRALAGDHLVQALAARRIEQGGEAQIVAGTGARRAAMLGEDPPGQSSGVGPDGPAFAGLHVGEGDGRLIGSDQMLGGPDLVQIGQHRAIARQHQVVAVVDHHAELGVQIGAAAAAGLGRALEHLHPLAASGEGHGGREAREPRADHIDGSAQPSSPWRSRIQSSSAFPSFTLRRGGAQPMDSVRSRIRPYAAPISLGAARRPRGRAAMTLRAAA